MNLPTSKQSFKAVAAFSLSMSMLLSQPVFASGKPYKKNIAITRADEEDKPAKKAKAKTKSMASLNNSSVKIYPDIIKRDMHVVAKSNDGKPIDFFVFDSEGTLIQQYKMEAKDHNKISGLKRGTYTYRVFCGDTETATGNFEIR